MGGSWQAGSVAAAVAVVACGGQVADEASPPNGDASTTVAADAQDVRVDEATVDADAESAADATEESAEDADDAGDVDASDFDDVILAVPYLARR
jgi:hypothetical protein